MAPPPPIKTFFVFPDLATNQTNNLSASYNLVARSAVGLGEPASQPTDEYVVSLFPLRRMKCRCFQLFQPFADSVKESKREFPGNRLYTEKTATRLIEYCAAEAAADNSSHFVRMVNCLNSHKRAVHWCRNFNPIN